MREIPKKNYFIFVIMVVCIIAIVLYASEAYTSKSNKKYLSPMQNFITEIKVDDIENYIIENSIVVLYVSDKDDENLMEREEKFKNLLIEYNIQQYFIYLDMSYNTEEVSKSFEERYEGKLDYNKLPILLVMLDGEVVGIYNEDIYDEAKIITFLKENEVIEVD